MMILINDAKARLRTVQVLMANLSDLLGADHLEAAKMTEKRLTGEVEELNKVLMELDAKINPPAPAPAPAQQPAPAPAQ